MQNGMQIDGFLEFARKRRSIRQFKADPVSDECINQILEAARLFEMHTFDQNLTCTAYAIHLAAASLGLGAQWLSLLPPVAEAMKTALGVSLELTLFNLNPIGYPAAKPVSHRRELSELVHHDQYDMKKFMSNDDIREGVRQKCGYHILAETYPPFGKGGGQGGFVIKTRPPRPWRRHHSRSCFAFGRAWGTTVAPCRSACLLKRSWTSMGGSSLTVWGSNTVCPSSEAVTGSSPASR